MSLIIETLRLANDILGAEGFRYHVVSSDGAPRTASSDMPARVDHAVDTCPPLGVVLVCTGMNSHLIEDPGVLRWLRAAYRSGSRVGAVSGGAFVLARAGLLGGRDCAIHWASGVALAEAFPHVRVSGDIFVIDGRIITCAGGISTLDLMLHLIEQLRGPALARRVADDLIYPHMRGGHEPARIELRRRTGVTNEFLLRAIEIMETHVEEPLKLTEISRAVGTSIRHLERLFARHFDVSPSQYYMRLRLREARGLLSQTDIPVVEVALRCGFPEHVAFRASLPRAVSPAAQQERRVVH